ncbi:MAG: hypothetical protein PHI42_07240 [Paludibacteraceae bacterium]|nr:hypothetical protein [Paludibacteraceae bacterium]
MENEHKEINLLDFMYLIFRGLARGLKRLGKSLLLLLRFSIQNSWVILAFIILAFFAGWFFTTPARTMFKGGSTILFVEEARPAVLDHVARLNSHCRTQDLAVDLHLPESIASKIRKFETFNYIDVKDDKIADFADLENNADFLTDTMNVVMNDRFYLRVSAKGITDFKPIQKGLQTYFDEQAGVVLLAQQGKARLQEQLRAYNREVKRLDSLANYDYFSQSKPIELVGGKTFVFAQKEKELFHEKLFEVMEQRDQAATQLAQNTHTINFQSDMVLMAPWRILCLFFWVLGGYVFGALVAWGIVRRKEVCAFLKK